MSYQSIPLTQPRKGKVCLFSPTTLIYKIATMDLKNQLRHLDAMFDQLLQSSFHFIVAVSQNSAVIVPVINTNTSRVTMELSRAASLFSDTRPCLKSSR